MGLGGELNELRALQCAARVGHHGHSGLVARLVHVVRCREHCEHRVLALVVVAVALGLHLVRPNGHLQVVVLHEGRTDVRAEQVDTLGHATGGAVALLALRVGPKEVHHQGVLGGVRLHEAVAILDLVQADLNHPALEADLIVHALPPDPWVWARNATVHHEDLVVQHMGQGRRTEDLPEQFAHFLLVLGLDLTEEAVEVISQLALVVAAIHENILRVPELEGQEGEHHLNTPGPTVNKVAIEDEGVVRRGIACQGQHVRKVVQLAVQVADHGDLFAFGHRDSPKCLLLLQDVESVDCHLVGVLHGDELPLSEVCQHLIDEIFVDRCRAGVPGAHVPHGLRKRSHVASNVLDCLARVRRRRWRDLVLDQGSVRRKVSVPGVVAVDVYPVGVICSLRVLIHLQFGELNGERELSRLVAHGTL
mmetsp:Transcript_64976/g.163720  ORF Transcript_64976/g.163720 Transcript_64976/m.163720 type:complete len:421 (+) Transcript_64976:324-1586(+)